MRDGGEIMVSKSTVVNKAFFCPDGEDLARALGCEQIQVRPHKHFVIIWA